MKKLKEGSAQEEMLESPSEEAKEPSEHELDMHHDTLMKAASIKGDESLMKHLKPHMHKKMKHMKDMMDDGTDSGKTGLDKLRETAKKKRAEG